MKIAESVTFGSSGLDRAAEIRGDVPRIAALLTAPSTRITVLWRGKPLIRDGGDERALDLVWLPAGHSVFSDARAAAVFLGRDAGGALFAQDISDWQPEGLQTADGFLDDSAQRHPALPSSDRFFDLRMMLTRLSARDAELAATAKAIWGWHHSHGFCARCGARNEMFKAGWEAICPACGAHHFPRTDPVVIMLVTRGNRTLLGRSAGWPEGMYSCLAGFVEPGEPVEAAVRREVWEEAGVRIGEVSYLTSQPWPFPSSLMLGCRAEALSQDITLDPDELEDARWVSREDLVAALAGQRDDIWPARRGSIAHFMLWNWLADRLD